MSIHNIINKIKSKSGIDKTTVMFLLIIVGVGIGAFGLGRISSNNGVVMDTTDIVSVTEHNIALNETYIKESGVMQDQPIQAKERRYVASKNGKIYYSIGCSGAKRIKPENEVWFGTAVDAEKSGFKASTSCK